MSQPDPRQNSFQSAVTFIVVAVAVLTLLIIFAALFMGLWLDRIFESRPAFTVGLMIASIPVTLVAIFRLVRIASGRITGTSSQHPQEEQQRGTGTAGPADPTGS
jgi:ABC-type protease/lipase transport system fused ATPase/permease subunit